MGAGVALPLACVALLAAAISCLARGSREAKSSGKLAIWGLQAFNAAGDNHISELVKRLGEERG